MNKRNYIFGALVIVFFIAVAAFSNQQREPWTPEQLLAPKDLAAIINSPTHTKPLIISIGPDGLIKGSVEAGQAKSKENLAQLKTLVSKEDKDREIVLYCGCCPFKDCPNIRPAFSLLNTMKFTNHKLLNLPNNLRVDWINHHYPLND